MPDWSAFTASLAGHPRQRFPRLAHTVADLYDLTAAVALGKKFKPADHAHPRIKKPARGKGIGHLIASMKKGG
jgi:hypothetical protein